MLKYFFLLYYTLGDFYMSTHPKFTREFEGIFEYKLENGLKILLFPDLSQSTVTVNITYLVGSRYEGRGETGMAHLLEHLLFKGTPKYPDIKGALENRGAFFNATTWYDRTNYFETMPASYENIKFALELESDRMINSWIRKSDLDSEMTVVRNEFEIGENDPINVLHDQILSSAFRWHNYGKSTIGNRSDIERVPIKNLKLFYKKYYQPDNAVLVISGKFEKEIAIKLVKECFGKISKPKRVLDQTYTEEPIQDGSRFVKLMRVGEVPIMGTSYHIPSGSHTDFAAIRIFIDILTQEPGGYLYDDFVKTGSVSDVFGFAYELAEPGMAMIFAKSTGLLEINELKDKLISAVENNQNEFITEERVKRSVARFLRDYKISNSDSRKISIHLSESIAQGDYRLYFWQRDQIKKVTVDDVKRVARNYFIESNRTSGVFLPVENPIRVQIQNSPSMVNILENYESKDTLAHGEEFDPTPKNLDQRTEYKTLKNNIRIASLYKKTRGDRVKVSLVFRYGTANTLTSYKDSAFLLPQLIMRGTKEKTFQQIQDELNILQSNVSMSGSLGKTIIDITSDKENIISVLGIVAEIIKKPALDEFEFEIIRKKELSDLEEAITDPKSLGFNELARLENPWPKESIYYVSNISESIDQVKNLQLSELKTLYNEFYSADNLNVSIIGSFNSKNIESEIEKHFSNWKLKLKKKFEPILKPFKEVLAENRKIITPDKQMALVAIGTNIRLEDTMFEYPEIRIATYILGESMKSRIWNRLREKDGLSYGAGSRLELNKQIANASLNLFAMVSNSNAERALSALKEEYTNWLEMGITEDELKESKNSYRLMIQNLLSNDAYLLSVLNGNMELNRRFDFQDNFLKQIENVTTEQILKTIKKLIAPGVFCEIKAGDV